MNQEKQRSSRLRIIMDHTSGGRASSGMMGGSRWSKVVDSDMLLNRGCSSRTKQARTGVGDDVEGSDAWVEEQRLTVEVGGWMHARRGLLDRAALQPSYRLVRSRESRKFRDSTRRQPRPGRSGREKPGQRPAEAEPAEAEPAEAESAER